MNIIEAYIYHKTQLIIAISGFITDKTEKIINVLCSDLKINKINLCSYYKTSFADKITFDDNTTQMDFESNDIYNWNDINNVVNNNKKNGIIIYSPYIPSEQCNFDIDIHIHITSNKHTIFDYMDNQIKKNPDIYKALINKKNLKHYVDNIIFKRYEQNIRNMKINKFIKLNDSNNNYLDELYGNIFDYIITKIKKFLYAENK